MIPMSAWAAEAKEKPFVAQRARSFVAYETLEDALQAVAPEGTYEIDSDAANPSAKTVAFKEDTTISDSISLGSDLELTLDLGGYTLDCSGGDLLALSDSASNTQVILKNGSVTNCSNLISTLPEGCSLTVEDGTYDLSCLAEHLYGQLTVQNGSFTCGDSFFGKIYNSGEVIIRDGTFDASEGSYGFDFICGQITIYDGSFLANDDLFYLYYDVGSARVVIHDGEFTSNGDLFDANSGDGVHLTVNGGTYTVNKSESSGNLLNLCRGGVAEINAGTFTSNKEDTLLVIDDASELNIHNGTFSAPGLVLQNSGTVNIERASFSSELSGGVTCMIENSGALNVQPGYWSTPAQGDWEGAKTITFTPMTISITYYTDSTESSEYHQETGIPSELTFPEDPANKEDGSQFLFWETKDGKKVTDLSTLRVDTKLYPVYADRSYTVTLINKDSKTEERVLIGTPLKDVPGFVVDDPFFYQWVDENQSVVSGETQVHSNLTLTASYSQLIYTYDELMEALRARERVICLGADIELADPVTVDYSCALTSQDGYGLIRSDTLTTDPLLRVASTKEDPVLVSLDGIVLDGKDIESTAPAIHVNSYATLEVSNTIIQNNINTVSGYQALKGGGICNEGTLNLYDGTILRNNQADSGGGVYCARPIREESGEYSTVEFYMYGGEITGNRALSSINSCLSAGGGVAMDSNGGVFSSFYMHGGKISNNTAPEGSGGGVTLGCGDHGFASADNSLACEDCTNAGHVPFQFFGGEITNNEAKKNGGGVWLGCSAMDMSGGLIAQNTAGLYGGAVSNCCRCSISLHMTGGSMTMNHAPYGGGIGAENYSDIYGTISNKALIYDNVASEIGDDLYEARLINENNEDEVVFIKNSFESRPYGSPATPKNLLLGPSALTGGGLPSVLLDLLPGEPTPESTVMVPFMGWYVDGVVVDQEYVEHPTLGWGLHPTVIDRFSSIQGKHFPLTADTINDTIKSGDKDLASLKSVWYGHVVLYKANDESDAHAYDTKAYLPGSDVTLLENTFQRKGYLFTGWNTDPDGNGTWYQPGESIKGLSKSTRLYAQWTATSDRINVFPANMVAFADGESRSGNEYKHFPRPFFLFELIRNDIDGNYIGTERLVNVPQKVEGQPDDVSWFYFESDPEQTLYQMTFFIDSGEGPEEYVFTEEPPYIYRYPFRVDYYYVDPETGKETLIDKNDTTLEPMGMYKMRTRAVDSNGNGTPDTITAKIDEVTYEFTSQHGDLEVRPIHPDKPTYFGETKFLDGKEVVVPPNYSPTTTNIPETIFPTGTRFANEAGYIAGEGQAVRTDIRLLTDELIQESTANAISSLTTKALGTAASSYKENKMFFLDLVNYANGNSLVHPIQADSMESVPITVFFPYPDGTNQNTNFKLFHFPEINRSVDTFGTDWSNTKMEEVKLSKLDKGILFTVDSFSPFQLLWQTTQGGGGGGGSTRADLTILKTDASTGAVLSGAKFELRKADGSLVGHLHNQCKRHRDREWIVQRTIYLARNPGSLRLCIEWNSHRSELSRHFPNRNG